MVQHIKAIKVDFLSAEIAVSNNNSDTPEVNIILSFQDVDEVIFNIALNNNNTRDLFNNLVNVYSEIGCPTAAVIKQFIKDMSNDKS